MEATLNSGAAAPSVGKVTIGDVAREARVGVGTVSRVLNDERVSPVLAERVREALAATGYVYQPRPWPWLARRKFRRACGDIGVLFIGGGDSLMARADVPCMIHCAERALAAQDRSLVVGNMSGHFSPDQFLRRRRLDGIIFIHLGGRDEERVWLEHATRLAKHIPHVWVNERPANTNAGVLCQIDTSRAGCVAADFLAGQDHEDVALVSGGGREGRALMGAAFAERARKNGTNVTIIRESALDVCARLAKEKVTGVFAPDYGMARRLAETLVPAVPPGRPVEILTYVLDKVLLQDPREGLTVMNLRFGALIELAIEHLIWQVARPVKSPAALNLSVEPVLVRPRF